MSAILEEEEQVARLELIGGDAPDFLCLDVGVRGETDADLSPGPRRELGAVPGVGGLSAGRGVDVGLANLGKGVRDNDRGTVGADSAATGVVATTGGELAVVVGAAAGGRGARGL